MSKLLIVHHTVSPATSEVLDAAKAALELEELSDVEVIARPALVASALETLEADGLVLLTPVNIGYLSGAMKHYFDQIYYPCLDATRKLPFAAVLHSNLDASGALRALEAITTGMEWTQVAAPVVITGAVDAGVREQITELAGTVGAYAAGLIS